MSMTRATSLSLKEHPVCSQSGSTRSRDYEVVRRQVQMQKAETGGQGKLRHIETHEKCSRVHRGGESRQGCHTSPLLCWCSRSATVVIAFLMTYLVSDLGSLVQAMRATRVVVAAARVAAGEVVVGALVPILVPVVGLVQVAVLLLLLLLVAVGAALLLLLALPACNYEYPYTVWICMEPQDYDDDDLSKTRKELFPASNFFPREGDATDLDRLELNQITYTLNAAAHEVLTTEEYYGDRYRCLRLSIEDDETYDIAKHMEAAFGFIEEARQKGAGILVHCVSGISRSPTIVIAYLMSYWKWPLKKVARFVQQKRPQVHPNNGFLKYLLSLDGTLPKSTA
ncbi:hypothetical protein EMCRGX_G022283 [Ephydatia muelleri]